MRQLPTGTVTFLFTDIEGSTRLLRELGSERYAEVLAEHRRRLRGAFERHRGVELDTEGDAFFVAFSDATDAVAAAAEAQAELTEGRVRVRMGLHTGEPLLHEHNYVGMDVHRAARICSTAHGGQVVFSERTHSLLRNGRSVRDLGRHRLKDLLEPERLYQLGDEEFPPLKSLNATNLPTQPTPLVGREQELGDVLGLLREGPTHLLTLTGAGGSGKTRLGLQAAAELVDEFLDGVFWVSLAALADPALVLPTVAQTVGAKNGLADYVSEKRLLLLLDNFEHLLPAASDVGDVLRECPNVRVLVTSRAVLRLAAEQEYEVPPLPETDAVRLFTQRARRASSGFEPDEHVAEICRRLDGLPLAIELAAARVKLLAPRDLLARLERSSDVLAASAVDLPERQRTLRATIEWSYGLLDGPERELFDRLGVFPGSFELEAAEAICGADLDALAGLVDKSLVRRTAEGRFFLLETIREFAVERLEATGQGDSLRARHASFFTDFAVEAEPQLRTRDLLTWFDRFRAEHDSIRAALDFLERRGEARAHARLAGACWYFWYLGGHFSEGLERLRSAFARSDELSPADRAVLHDGVGCLSALVGQPQELVAHAEASLAIRRELGAPAGLLRSLLHSASAAERQGRSDEAKALYRECVDLARAQGDRWFQAVASGNLGWMLQGEGDYELARSIGVEALALAEQVGDPFTVRALAMDLAFAEVELGLHEAAAPRMRRVVEECADGRTPELLVWAIGGLATVEAEAGDARRGARLMGAAEAAASRISYEIHQVRREKHERALATLRKRLGDAELDAELRAGREMTGEDAIALALAP